MRESSGRASGQTGWQRDRRRLLLAGGVAGAVVLGRPAAARAELFGPPKSDLWSRWERHGEADTRTIDHAAWDGFLRKYLDTRHLSCGARMEPISPSEPRW
jgi:hypothetical protein